MANMIMFKLHKFDCDFLAVGGVRVKFLSHRSGDMYPFTVTTFVFGEVLKCFGMYTNGMFMTGQIYIAIWMHTYNE